MGFRRLTTAVRVRPIGRIWAWVRQVWATRSWWRRSLLVLGSLLLLFIGSSVSLTLVYAVVPVPMTPLMVIRSLEYKKAGKPAGWRKTWVSEQGMSPHLKLAVICAEDQNFLHHRGFDFGAIEKAREHNKRSRRKRGASTISMQTAKNVFLWPGRSWLRKGLEVWFTTLIETFWSKRRIMTVYLNIVEWGPGIYGAEAASQAYFKKPAARLTPSEAALLAAVLPSPLRYSVTRPGPFVQHRRDWVLRQMQLHGGAQRLEANPKW
jgi:monofunctional biosynthetic peptidoglycan transglycosylase